MTIWEIIMFALGLAMDAFAVSVAAGLSVGRLKFRHYMLAGTWFGGFQGLMPILGYFIAIGFASFIKSVDHWIAFVLLGLIGVEMILSSFKKEDTSSKAVYDFTAWNMFVLALATSIDALAAGISFAFLEVDIWLAAFVITAVTFLLSCLGLRIGHVCGARYKSWAGLLGGVILIATGTKILIEHLTEM